MLIFAIFIVVLIIAERFFSATIKLIWQRLRFINIEHTTYSGYTPWWIPHFTSSGREHLVFGELNSKTFMSFNSGTTAAAGNLFAIIMLPEIFKKLKKYRPLFYIIPILYCSLVGASKIIAGQHYITDVIFSIILVYSLTVILKRICLSQKFKKFANFCINLFYKDKTEHIPLNNINT
ncbi:MAG: phosphatase PAP2 family protein, partial [Clostridia bacterium]|nr:phosphatase PAP2 family protein [Clostridia bacterium]